MSIQRAGQPRKVSGFREVILPQELGIHTISTGEAKGVTAIAPASAVATLLSDPCNAED